MSISYSQQQKVNRTAVITHDDFYDQVVPLAEFKMENGLDVKVVRIPANSTTDVENMLNKIINYVPLTNKVLLFGNSPETAYADSDEPILTAAGFVVDRAYDATACLETTNRINDGRLLAVYYGHGCVTGAGCALTESNIDELENTSLPVVLSGGCFNMHFDHSTDTSLGELLVLMPEGGAIAFVGSTRTGGYGYQYSFVDGFSDELTGSAVLGRMMNSGRIAAYNAALDADRDVGDGSWTQGHIEQINLLGDPGLSIEPVFVRPLPEFDRDPGRILPGDPPSARRFQDGEQVLR